MIGFAKTENMQKMEKYAGLNKRQQKKFLHSGINFTMLLWLADDRIKPLVVQFAAVFQKQWNSPPGVFFQQCLFNLFFQNYLRAFSFKPQTAQIGTKKHKKKI
jgi:hypothetical protein